MSNSSFIDEIPIPAIDEIKQAGYERTDNDDLDEDEWIHPNYNDEDDRNIFDVLDDELDVKNRLTFNSMRYVFPFLTYIIWVNDILQEYIL